MLAQLTLCTCPPVGRPAALLITPKPLPRPCRCIAGGIHAVSWLLAPAGTMAAIRSPASVRLRWCAAAADPAAATRPCPSVPTFLPSTLALNALQQLWITWTTYQRGSCVGFLAACSAGRWSALRIVHRRKKSPLQLKKVSRLDHTADCSLLRLPSAFISAPGCAVCHTRPSAQHSASARLCCRALLAPSPPPLRNSTPVPLKGQALSSTELQPNSWGAGGAGGGGGCSLPSACWLRCGAVQFLSLPHSPCRSLSQAQENIATRASP